jgi:hypothetical protein
MGHVHNRSRELVRLGPTGHRSGPLPHVVAWRTPNHEVKESKNRSSRANEALIYRIWVSRVLLLFAPAAAAGELVADPSLD